MRKQRDNTSDQISRFLGKIPLRYVLVVPFVLQIFAAVGLTSWLSLRNSQQAVNEVATQLRRETTARIQQHLESYLEIPQLINQLNANAFALGELDINNPSDIERHFAQQIQVFDSVSYIYLGNAQGGIISPGRRQDGSFVIEVTEDFAAGDYNIYASTPQGERMERLSSTPNYDARLRPWYVDAVKAGKPAWGQIYLYFAEQVLAMPASLPLYDKTGGIQGVLSVDLLLSHMSQFLQTLEIGRSGQSFILERSGWVVASSILEDMWVDGDRQNGGRSSVPGPSRRILAQESTDPLLRATAQSLIQSFGNLEAISSSTELEFEIEPQHDGSHSYSGRQFLQVTPFQDEGGLDWLVVVVIPENDFMEKINANRKITLLLCGCSLLVATGLAIMTARWITQPILKLSRASQAISEGKLEQQVGVKGINELGVLAGSFNSMAEQLKTSFAALEWANLELEKRVDERTVELTQAKEAAESASQAKSQFLSHMSHELRTPLNAILGFAQLMQVDSELSPKLKDYVNIIDRSGEHLLELVNDVLSMSKIEAGQVSLHDSIFELRPFLTDLKNLFVLRAASKGLTLGLEVDPQLPACVITDEAKLRQVLINLLGNAIKFTRQGGVHLSVRAAAQPLVSEPLWLQFCVEDTGPGIAEAEIPSLFDAFTQGNIRVSSQEGTGLGLPISQQFVALMGGELRLKSRVGQGTRCEFEIPARLSFEEESPADGEQQQAACRVVALASGQPTYRVLVVEDDQLSRLLLLKVLRPLGFEVHEATNGEEAVTQWQRWQPHLIFMDMQMPVMDGNEATRQIRRQFVDPCHHSEHPQIYPVIIALTASALEEDRARSLAAGCDDFLGKPYRREVLLEKLVQYLGVIYRYEALEQASIE